MGEVKASIYVLVESLFFQYTGRSLTGFDLELIRKWEREGVKAQVVVQALVRAFEKRAQGEAPPRSLAFAQREIEVAIERQRQKRVGGRSPRTLHWQGLLNRELLLEKIVYWGSQSDRDELKSTLRGLYRQIKEGKWEDDEALWIWFRKALVQVLEQGLDSRTRAEIVQKMRDRGEKFGMSERALRAHQRRRWIWALLDYYGIRDLYDPWHR